MTPFAPQRTTASAQASCLIAQTRLAAGCSRLPHLGSRYSVDHARFFLAESRSYIAEQRFFVPPARRSVESKRLSATPTRSSAWDTRFFATRSTFSGARTRFFATENLGNGRKCPLFIQISGSTPTTTKKMKGQYGKSTILPD